MADKNFTTTNKDILGGVQYTTVLGAFNTTLADINLPRGIALDADGTIEFEYANGSNDTLTLAAGVLHPIMGFTNIISSSLLVSQIHVVY